MIFDLEIWLLQQRYAHAMAETDAVIFEITGGANGAHL